MPETYLTAADRDLIRVAAALYGWASEDEAQEALEKGVERIVRRHRAEALGEYRDALAENESAEYWSHRDEYLHDLDDWIREEGGDR